MVRDSISSKSSQPWLVNTDVLLWRQRSWGCGWNTREVTFGWLMEVKPGHKEKWGITPLNKVALPHTDKDTHTKQNPYKMHYSSITDGCYSNSKSIICLRQTTFMHFAFNHSLDILRFISLSISLSLNITATFFL